MSLAYRLVPVTPFAQNCSVIWCEKTRRGAVVDPGGDLDLVEDAVAAEGIELEKILVTHGHIDHVGGVAELAQRARIPIEGPQRSDAMWIDNLSAQAAMFGLPPSAAFTPDRWLEGGDQVVVGEQSLSVLHCPGHTPGHIVFFHRSAKLAFVGDVLFRGSVGRTDLPGGSRETLLDSIRTRLLPLGDDVTFVPGHGPTSTLGRERRSNPFVRM